MPELIRITSGISYSKNNQTFSVYISQFGNKLYREIISGFGYSYKFKEQDIGLRFKPSFLSIENYGSKFLWGADLGLRTHINDKIAFGFCAYNILSGKYSENNEYPAKSFNSQVIFEIFNNNISTISISHLQNRPFRYSINHIFNLNNLNIIAGIVNNPFEYSIGVEINFSGFNTLYNISSHPDLGYSHNLAISYQKHFVEKGRISTSLLIIIIPEDTISVSIFPININIAGAELLQILPGIGPVMAQRIISYREENGFFKEIQDIYNIRGVGDFLFEKIKPYIIIE